jgi:hypothetical protein
MNMTMIESSLNRKIINVTFTLKLCKFSPVLLEMNAFKNNIAQNQI